MGDVTCRVPYSEGEMPGHVLKELQETDEHAIVARLAATLRKERAENFSERSRPTRLSTILAFEDAQTFSDRTDWQLEYDRLKASLKMLADA